jgi:hypothetical protein
MNQHVSAADRLPLPPVTPRAMRSVHAEHARREPSPLLPPFVPGQPPPRWRAPSRLQHPLLAVHAATPAVPPPESDSTPATSSPPDDLMPWETAVVEAAVDTATGAPQDADAQQDVAAPQDTDAPQAVAAPQDADAPQAVAKPQDADAPVTTEPAPVESWDPAQLWDDAPVTGPATSAIVTPEELPVASGRATLADNAGVSDETATPPVATGSGEPPPVAERVASRLESLAAEVRASGIAALGAADDSDELSRLLAGVIAGFLARDAPHE